MAIYFWIEDRENKSGYTFWSKFLENMFPGVILESKANNSKLLKAVMSLADKENTYIIAYDHSFDNPQVIREIKLLKKQLQSKANIMELDIICFEVQKGKLGSCWIENCCEWTDRLEDDICGLDNSKISARNKMEEIYHFTSLQKELKKCGLEVG